MLFDLQGRRRRVVQATYLMLAVLMGGGLVFFGIGSDVSGGLVDAFKGEDGGGNGNSVIEKRLESAQRRAAANPRDEAALKELVRGHYQLAGQNTDRRTFRFTREGKAQLAKAASAWERYLALEPEQPDVGLARFMVQAYAPEGINRPSRGAEAAELVAEEDKPQSAQNYLILARYAQEAGQTRKADLAGDKALELAKGGQKKQVKAALKQIKQGSKAGGAVPQPQG